MSFFITKQSEIPSMQSTDNGLVCQMLGQQGLLVYEYNPLKVFRINEDKYLEDNSGSYILYDEQYIPIINDYIEGDKYKFPLGDNKFTDINLTDLETYTKYTFYPKNSILDLDTEDLTFNLTHPVNIEIQPSYDGSVNLLLVDGQHAPKLINSRFSCTGGNTYQIVDRSGDNDTNIYDQNTFDVETSLYKKITKIPKLDFLGISQGGNLKVGNYVFYFKLVDADGNETDIVAESGIVSCYIGNINDPKSQRGGLEDENSYKVVNFTLSNIDQAYSYVNVYFTRSTGVREGDEYTTAHKVLNQFYINNGRATINITGFEHTMESSIEDLNVRYDIVETAKTQIQCQNMLFLGNIQFPVLDTKELQDLSLRICPHLYVEDSIGRVDENYEDPSGGYEYYNALNIYNKLGYWDDEIYRFGIVYILNDLSLSPVFNIRGCQNLGNKFTYQEYPLYTENGQRNYIIIDKETNLLSNNENVKGVVKINNTTPQITNDGTYPIGLTFKIPKKVVSELKKHTKGFFFVRQPRLKTTFCQAITVGKELESNTPILKSEDGYFAERFINDDRILTHNFEQRLQHVDDGYILKGGAALCPEYELNLAFYNQFFTSSEFTIRESKFNFANQILNKKDRYFYNIEYSTEPSSQLDYSCTITSVPDNTKAVKGKYSWFSARAGEAEDATMFANIGYRNKQSKATNLLRGSYGSYLGLEGLASIDMTLVDIKIPAYNEASMHEYFKIRFRDKSEFKAISDRYSWDDLAKDEEDEDYLKIDGIYRGDCYICNFTHRMNRNFQDPETPTIDEFVDGNTWKDNYSTGKNDSEEKRLQINRSDVNAVKIGHWVTFKIKSSTNLSLRCINPFYITEYGMTGQPRSFYPLQGMDPSGNAKLPESDLMSAGFNVNLPSRIYFEIADTPSDLSKYQTRIMFSDISVLNGYKNGYRTFRTQNHRDYSLQYGQLIRMMEWSGNIFAIFEHGVALIAVNERALAAQGTGGSAFINTLQVLPENPVILSDSFGSQWHDSIVQTPYAIYGVDTVAKKIWKIHIKGSLQKQFVLDVISDFKVQKFLNDNISLTEHELTPIIGIRNVKTHYNANKNDVMFTFYDDINTIQEKVWNLCYNEVLDKFITFYSWIPSFSENIDNIFFSFDRETSKNVAKLYCDQSDIQIDSGPIINYTQGDSKLIGKLSIPILDQYYIINTGDTNQEYKKPSIKFEIADERLQGMFLIDKDKLYATSTKFINDSAKEETLWKIPIKATMNQYVQNMQDRDQGIIESVMYNTITKASQPFLNSQEDTYFWKHGQAGLTKTKDKIKPTHWYGKQHPFEFEFMVANNPASHKIFTDLCIIANKAEPESLHFEITGEVYKFADDKKNMFFRQEAIKHLYQYKGADVLYDSRYLDMIPEQRDIPYSTSQYKDKSTMFPMYYSRVDTINDIEDYYQSKCISSKDYQKLSGSEIIYDETLNEFKIATHIKACPFGKQYKQEISEEEFLRNKHYSNFIEGEDGHYYKIDTYGRLNGNISYNEDLWYAQIPSIIYWEKNEKEWTVRDSDGNKYPPLNVANNPVPEGINNLTISNDLDIPKDLRDKGYKLDNYGSFDTSIWENRKETRLRDRFLKVRIRYTGNDLAVIYAIRTLYTISYV